MFVQWYAYGSLNYERLSSPYVEVRRYCCIANMSLGLLLRQRYLLRNNEFQHYPDGGEAGDHGAD